MKWNLRWAAARRDIWRPSDLLTAFQEVGFTPSLSKVAALWSGKPISVRLDDLDKMCAALGCTIADLLEAEPLADAGDGAGQRATGGQRRRAAGRHHHGAGPGDRCHRTDRCLLPGTGRSGSALSAWAGASCASARPARHAPNGDGPSPGSRTACGAAIGTTSAPRDYAGPACRRSASTIPAGSSAQCPDGQSSSGS